MVWWSTGMENSYIPKSIRTQKKKKHAGQGKFIFWAADPLGCQCVIPDWCLSQGLIIHEEFQGQIIGESVSAHSLDREVCLFNQQLSIIYHILSTVLGSSSVSVQILVIIPTVPILQIKKGWDPATAWCLLEMTELEYAHITGVPLGGWFVIWLLCSWSSILLVALGEKNTERWPSCWGLRHLCGRVGWSCWILASDSLNPGHCGPLGCESVDERSLSAILSLCSSDFQIYK